VTAIGKTRFSEPETFDPLPRRPMWLRGGPTDPCGDLNRRKCRGDAIL